jgi:hypothetical protein
MSEDNNTKPCRLIPAAGLALFLSLFGVVRFASGQEEPTPTEPNMVSLFPDDICSPPCWFGLIPGESTTEDVINMFNQYNDLFIVNPRRIENGNTSELVADMEPLLNGQGVEFRWLKWNRDDDWRTPNNVGITDNILTSIYIILNEDVSLENTLNQLGRPFVIRATYSLYIVELLMFYPDEKLIIFLAADRFECQANSMMRDFEVLHLLYLSDETYLTSSAEVRRIGFYVPHQIFDGWMSGEVEGTCEEAIQALVDAAA